MGMSLSLDAGSEVLRVIATGEFSLEAAEQTFLELLDAVARHKSEKVLFDGRALKGDPGTIHRFLYGKFAADAVVRYIREGRVSRAPQFAYVLQEPVLDPQRLGETAAANRGMRVKAFDNPKDALGWLSVAPTTKPEAGDA